jgi:ubiquinone/menaquinone biosynthesis C-methylase UbiE
MDIFLDEDSFFFLVLEESIIIYFTLGTTAGMLFNFDKIVHIYDIIMPKRVPVELLKSLHLQRHEKILEIGAGTGRITKYYASLVDHLVLVDPAKKMLEKAVKLIPHAKAVIGFAENLGFAANEFNRIIAYDSFHHWLNQVKGLQECYRVLQPSGKLYLVEVDPENFWGHKVTIFERLLNMGSKFYTPAVLTEIVKKIGFKKIVYDPLSGGLAYLLECWKT